MLLASIITLIVPVLLSVAMFTLAERTIMASMQRRFGPGNQNVSGIGGILQPFWDALRYNSKIGSLVRTNTSFTSVSLVFDCSAPRNYSTVPKSGTLAKDLNFSFKSFFWPAFAY